MKLSLRTSSLLTFSTLTMIVICSCFIFVATANAQSWTDNYWSSYNGFEAWRFDYVGPSTVCAPGELEMEYRIRDAYTRGPLTSSYNLWAQVRRVDFDDGNLYRNSWQYVPDGERLYVCSSVDDWTAVEIEGNPGSIYQGTNISTIRASTTEARINEQGGHYIREVYLRRRDDANPTVSPVFPVEVAVNEIPRHRVQLHEIMNQFGATEVSGLYGEVQNVTTDDRYYEFRYVTGGVGEYEGPLIPLADGYHEWFVKFDFNGITPSLNGLLYSGIGNTTFIDSWISYILDRVNPTSAVATVVEATNPTTLDIRIDNTVSDDRSGLRNTRVIVRNLDTATETVIQHNFSLLAGGFVGPWADPELVTAVVTLDRTTNYEIVAITTDVAGNETTSNVQTFTAEVVPVEPPVTNANLKVWNFDVPIQCTAEMAAGNGGVCPSIDARMEIYNYGVEIPAGTAIPYTFQYQEVGTGVWQTGLTGSWTDGIAAYGSTPQITVQYTGIPYGNYIARVIVNEPVNTELGETDFSNNTSGERALTDGSGVILTNVPDLKVINFSVPNLCEYDVTAPAGTCADIEVVFQMYNRYETIPAGADISYVVQYREVGGSWADGPTGVWSDGIPADAATAVISEMIPGIPHGEYEVRIRINEPVNAAIGEVEFSDNTTGPLPLTQGVVPAPPVPPDVAVTAFTVPSPCTYTSAQENDPIGTCPDIGVQFQITNPGGAIAVGTAVPYTLEYQLQGSGAWTALTGTWTDGIADGGTTPAITRSVNDLPYGNYVARVIVNQPVNTALGEADFTNNTSPTVPLVAAPGPADIALDLSRNIVRKNDQVEISWVINAPYPVTCQLSGSLNQTINHVPPVTDTTTTPLMSAPVTGQQRYQLSCGSLDIGGFTVPATSVTQILEMVPEFQES